MPIYEYECGSCGEIEEAIQKFSDKPLVKCKNCSGKLQKLVSQSTFHLKGSGWYVTDYADKSKGNSSADKSNGSSSADKSNGNSSPPQNNKEENTASKKKDSKKVAKADS